MKTEYGIPVPRGVRKDWRARPKKPATGGSTMRYLGVPRDWGDPVNCVAWYDRFNRPRACVGHYANGRSALVRIDENGVWKTTFGDVA